MSNEHIQGEALIRAAVHDWLQRAEVIGANRCGGRDCFYSACVTLSRAVLDAAPPPPSAPTIARGLRPTAQELPTDAGPVEGWTCGECSTVNQMSRRGCQKCGEHCDDRAARVTVPAPVQGEALAKAIEAEVAGVLDPDEGYCLAADCGWHPDDGKPHDACIYGRLIAALATPPIPRVPTYQEEPGRDYRKERDAAYTERNRVVAALARLIVAGGGWAWLADHPEDPTWDPEWRTIVFIEGPTGQLSWHLHDSDVPLFEGLPRGENVWDGHTTPEKYERVAKLVPPPSGATTLVPCSVCAKPTPMPEFFRVYCGKACSELSTRGMWRAPQTEPPAVRHEVRDTGDDHWMTGWPRWACSCGMTGASRTVPTRCPNDKPPAAAPPSGTGEQGGGP